MNSSGVVNIRKKRNKARYLDSDDGLNSSIVSIPLTYTKIMVFTRKRNAMRITVMHVGSVEVKHLQCYCGVYFYFAYGFVL